MSCEGVLLKADLLLVGLETNKEVKFVYIVISEAKERKKDPMHYFGSLVKNKECWIVSKVMPEAYREEIIYIFILLLCLLEKKKQKKRIKIK